MAKPRVKDNFDFGGPAEVTPSTGDAGAGFERRRSIGSVTRRGCCNRRKWI